MTWSCLVTLSNYVHCCLLKVFHAGVRLDIVRREMCCTSEWSLVRSGPWRNPSMSQIIFTQIWFSLKTPWSIRTSPLISMRFYSWVWRSATKLWSKWVGLARWRCRWNKRIIGLKNWTRKSMPTAIGEYHLYGDLCTDDIEDISGWWW